MKTGLKTVNIGMKVAVNINGRSEIGTVLTENNSTVWLKFEYMARTPVLKVKKKKCRLLFGDVFGRGDSTQLLRKKHFIRNQVV